MVVQSWKTSDLRLKSWDNLNKLWYVLLQEKNLLMTQRQMLSATQLKYVPLSTQENGKRRKYMPIFSFLLIGLVVGDEKKFTSGSLCVRSNMYLLKELSRNHIGGGLLRGRGW
ncbi:hypothetical protein HYC85_018117 [Camellia sinensis]|uniref:Large ribosomal subunit protein uL29m n=1 Tax=Camellia sinensis TaxID=4442 RepID=A0A7J7GTN9_CAMSI|nr:hypothetical protein HYC85_018117 [Camellia sinensis]